MKKAHSIFLSRLYSKTYLFLVSLMFLSQVNQAQDFITQWTFPSSATSITFNALTAGGAVNYTWSTSPSGNSGSGSFTKTIAGSVTLTGLTIPAGNVVTLSMTPTNLRRFYINNGADRVKLTDVSQWGAVPWTSMQTAFYGCTNLQISATDIPVLTGVTYMSYMFGNCSLLNSPSNIGSWNTSTVTDMSYMFYRATNFNQNINSWNISLVTDLSLVFCFASNFNQPLNNWNTSNVNSLFGAFTQATNFNQFIGNWNTANVTNMQETFSNASNFNQPLNDWNTSSVNNTSQMFYNALNFNQPLNSWNTSNVTNMRAMFNTAEDFNQSLDNWNTSLVQDMAFMFEQAYNFNQPLNNWNTSSVTNMMYMFDNTPLFNQPLNNWITSNVTSMTAMFQNSAFNQDISSWNTSAVTSMTSMFNQAYYFNQPLGTWILNTSVDLSDMLRYCGMDCANYSNTLMGWYNLNPSVINRNLGAIGVKYSSSVGASQRANLVLATSSGGRGWTITGDAIGVSSSPNLVAINNTRITIGGCNDGAQVDPSDQVKKLISFNNNGNNFNPSTGVIKITNAFVSSIPTGVTTSTNGGGYYQIKNDEKTTRIGRRMFSVQVPGTYATNGGVKVRIYFAANDTTNIRTDAMPSGSLADWGWFKSPQHTPQDVVNSLTTFGLTGAQEVVATLGTESGVAYAEFTVPNFSTFGYFARTTSTPLPIDLLSFDGKCFEEEVKLSWQTASEKNNEFFTLERSLDTEIWEIVNTKPGAGNSNERLSYTLVDKQPLDNAYYRLKQTDFNGNFEYSYPIFVSCDQNILVKPLVYPNPSLGDINIQWKKVTEPYHFILQSLHGQTIFWRLGLSKEQENIQIPTIAPGVYVYQLKNKEGDLLFQDKLIME